MFHVIVLSIFVGGIFLALLFLEVTSWKTRFILAILVAAAWQIYGVIGTLIATSVLSVGILIAAKIPR